jgi:hypothetical protein
MISSQSSETTNTATDFEPIQEDIQSPDFRALAEYEEYCRHELPRDFRVSLEEMVYKEGEPFEENIRSRYMNQLMNMIRDCQDRVFSRYRATATPALQSSAINSRKSSLPAIRSSNPQDMSYSSLEPIVDRGNSSEILGLEPLQPPALQSNITPGLESTNSHRHARHPAENNLSDSGYTNDVWPLLSSEHLGQSVMVSPSKPSQSHAASGELFTQRLSSQNAENFENAAIGIQKSYDFFDNSGNVGNPLENSWMADIDPSIMLDRVDWNQFVGTDPALGPPS